MGTIKEKIWIAIAWHLPHVLVKWVAVRVLVNATTGAWANHEMPDVKAMDAIARWESLNYRSMKYKKVAIEG